MAGNMSIKLFVILSLFTLSSFAQSLLDALRDEGFNAYAAFLQGSPAGQNIIAQNDIILYVPTNAAFIKHQLYSQVLARDMNPEDAQAYFQAIYNNRFTGDTSTHNRRSSDSACSTDISGPGAVDLMSLLDDAEYVNLPPGQNASIVQKNMPKGSLPVVHSGLGEVVQVVGLDIHYDNGIIRPVSGLFTLPRLLSLTLPFLGADKTLAVLNRTGLIHDLDDRTGITFLAPDDKSIPSDLPDNVLADILRRHTIVGLPVFTSDLHHGDSYQTLAGTTVTVTEHCGDVFIGGARILAGDAIIKNGVVHTVDRLLEAPMIVTTTQVQTVTQTATETTEVQTTVATTETTTETAGTTETTTETIEITTPETTTTTETVTPCLESTPTVESPPPPESTPCTDSTDSTSSTVYTPPPPPPPTSSIIYTPPPPPPPPTSSSVYTPPPPPPPPTYTPLTSTSVYVPPQPPISSSVYLPPPPPPPTYTTSTSSSTYALPPPSSEPESTPCTSESTTSTSSSVNTPPPRSSTPPPPSYPPWTPPTSSSIYTPPPSSSAPPPPSYPPWTPSTYSTEWTVSVPESTPCESSEPTLATPTTVWYYSSTTLVTSHRITSVPVPTYDSVVAPPETSEPCTTSGSYGDYGGYGDHGEHGKGGDSNWDASHEGRPGGY